MKTYLACPCTHADALVRKLRFKAASTIAAQLIQEKSIVYSPAIRGQSIGLYSYMPSDWAFWQTHCFKLLSWVSSLCVVNISGMDESVGV